MVMRSCQAMLGRGGVVLLVPEPIADDNRQRE